MNLQEAIQHCLEKSQGCDDCAQEHGQLAEWLIELLEYRECDVDILRDGCKDCPFFDTNTRTKCMVSPNRDPWEWRLVRYRGGRRMTNEEWLKTLRTEELARLITIRKCDFCLYNIKENNHTCDNCGEGIYKWLKTKHKNPMPEIKIGDAIYSYIDESRVMFIVVSNIHACDSHGVIVRWQELDNIWKIERMNDEKEMLEVIWRADNG